MRADILKKELGIFTFKDMLEHYPFRHLDKTKVEKIASLSPNNENEYVQIAGRINDFGIIGEKRAKRLVAYLRDDTGEIELIWFQGISWAQKMLSIGQHYLAFGKLGFYMGNAQMAHPEIEVLTSEKTSGKKFLDPIYPSTEKLKARGLNGRAMGKLTYTLLKQLSPKDIGENLPANVIKEYRFISRFEAYNNIHFPSSDDLYTHALRRLKFEELFFAQLRLGLIRSTRHRFSKGWIFGKVGDLFNTFYSQYLPFELTGAQKKSIERNTHRYRQRQANEPSLTGGCGEW